MKLWWHGTSVQNFESIYAKGLIANRKKKNYSSDLGISTMRDLKTYGGVYFASSIYRAHGLAGSGQMSSSSASDNTQLLIGVSLDETSKRIILDEDDIFFFIEDYCFRRLIPFLRKHEKTVKPFVNVVYSKYGLTQKSLKALYEGLHSPEYYTVLLGYVQSFFNGMIQIFSKSLGKNTHQIFKSKSVIMGVQRVLDLYVKHLISVQTKGSVSFWPEVDRGYAFKTLKRSVSFLCRQLKELFLLEDQFTNLRSLENVPLGGPGIPPTTGQIQIIFECTEEMKVKDVLFINPTCKAEILQTFSKEIAAAAAKVKKRKL